MVTSDSQKRASTKYNKENMKYTTVSMHKDNDADVIARLEAVGNKSEYIKRLIREDMERN